MSYELNFALLGAPVDVGAAINAGYQTGRARRLQGMQDSAFATLATNPNDPAGLSQLVASGHPEQAHQMREWGREERGRDWARAAQGGAAFPGATLAAPAPGAFAPATASPAAMDASAAPAAALPAPSAPASAPAAPRAPGQLDPEVMRRWFMEDPEGAHQFQTAWSGLTASQRAAEGQRFVAAEPVLATAATLPYARRRAFIAQSAPELVRNGWSQQELDSFDPTDENVQVALRHAMPIAEQHTFFAPLEGSPGAVYRDPLNLNVTAANPTQPRDETYYDANGNQVIRTVPGTSAIGPGAALFGQGATIQPSLDLPTVATPQEAARLAPGTRFRDPEGNVRTVPGGPTQPASGTFPRQDGGAFDFNAHPTSR